MAETSQPSTLQEVLDSHAFTQLVTRYYLRKADAATGYVSASYGTTIVPLLIEELREKHGEPNC